jgi:predicted RNA-binding Zn-ribbon protein involved in translation (DUF1610 family)
MKITEADFQQHAKDYDGYCMHCDKITTEGVEPDAANYECPECGHMSVFGVEMALIMGRIQFIDEASSDEAPSDESSSSSSEVPNAD